MTIELIQGISLAQIESLPEAQVVETNEISTPFFHRALEINADLNKASEMLEAKALGKDVATHELMIAFEQAKLSLQLTTQVRNKLLEGYQEIMRMQL